MRKMFMTAAFVLAMAFSVFADGNIENPGINGNIENPGFVVTIVQNVPSLLP